MESHSEGFGTRAVHAGQRPDPTTGAIMTPVYLTSTYVQEAPAVLKNGYDYSRTKNPTRVALEANLASLENGRFGLAFSSGMGAANTVLNLLKQGDHVVASDDLYGGTYRLFTKLYRNYGLTFTFVDASDLDRTRESFTERTKLLFVESPSNPLLKVSDLKALADLARERGVMSVCDNTFASPYLQNPLDLGFDAVLHSTTKYLAGHSDVVGGALVTNDPDLRAQLAFFQNAVGAVPGPMDCFLVLRGTKTLHLRMERHCQNAAAVANFLAAHERVKRVYYPGLPASQGHEIAAKQMRSFGGMVSFELDASDEDTKKVAAATRLFSLAESLGGVESLLCHPASMTHASIPAEERHARGLSDGLVRLSVGVEDVADLLEDLKQAISAI
ncbi:MAG: cystathionine gamma-synthase [Planctomycetota bacterium]